MRQRSPSVRLGARHSRAVGCSAPTGILVRMHRPITPDALRLTVLDESGVLEACRQTYRFWHQGRAEEPYVQRVLSAVERMGSEMRYMGLVSEDGALAASARALDGGMECNGVRIRSMGIAAVYVRDDLRGRGIGAALIERLLADARARGYQSAFLFSDIAPAYYARHGFREYPALDWSAPVGSLPASPGLAIRRAGPSDRERLRDWHRAAALVQPMGVTRTPVWWDFFRWWRGAPDDYILCDGSREVGYVNVGMDQTCLRVHEWAAPGVEPSRIWATIRARAADLRADRVGGWLRPDRRTGFMNVEARSGAIPMAVSLQPDIALPEPSEAFFDELDHF